MVLCQQMKDRIPQHLDLPRSAMAGVNLQRTVAGGEQRAGVVAAGGWHTSWGMVGPYVRLDQPQEPDRLGLSERLVVVDHRVMHRPS